MTLPSCLPLDPTWVDEDTYVASLLSFATDSDVFRNLCGGIHVLDFLTREPDLYTTVLPADWRTWFDSATVDDVLDLLLREDVVKLMHQAYDSSPHFWRGLSLPPLSLLGYIECIRKHCLVREVSPGIRKAELMPRHLAVGMKPKKMHEVSKFAAYVDKLSTEISESTGAPVLSIVDFGSGQNYLGRTLASPPYNKHVIAIEQRHHNIRGAKGMDVYAQLSKKEKIVRNKKEYRRSLENATAPASASSESVSQESKLTMKIPTLEEQNDTNIVTRNGTERGSIAYIEHEIIDGNLGSILSLPNAERSQCSTSAECSSSAECAANESCIREKHMFPDPCAADAATANLLVVSLHSCGNLLHHGLRSLLLNRSVSAVAMIGCCYNLMTERLGPATYKLPTLRPFHPRLESTSTAYDPHGFPLSQTLEDFQHKHGRGVRLNITARMMAVQAPRNWGHMDSEEFFTRHFFRALLQRILLDRGVLKKSSDPDSIVGSSMSGRDTVGSLLIIGSLQKACFGSFKLYVRAAIAKLCKDQKDGQTIQILTKDLSDEIIDAYEADWAFAKKNLSIIWSLMAFSAEVVESIITVDRWIYLREQDVVERCWVEPVFDYAQSPRNLVVVGLKK